MNVELSPMMLKAIGRLRDSGLYGANDEEVVQRLLEERLRQLISEEMFQGLERARIMSR